MRIILMDFDQRPMRDLPRNPEQNPEQNREEALPKDLPRNIPNRPKGMGSKILSLIAAIGLGGCVATTPPESEIPLEPSVTPIVTPTVAASLDSPSLTVVTTIAPMTQFTQAIAGNRAEVVQMIPSNVGIHDFQAKPRDVETIARADVLVQNGVGLEAFLTDLIRNANNPDLAIVEASEGIPTLSSAAASPEEPAADPGSESGDRIQEEDDHGHGHRHDHGGANPHLWLDPQRAIAQVENIRQGLIAADPQGQAIYEANAAAYIQALKDLDQDIGSVLSPYAGQTFITFHDFAIYFADRYGLQVQFLVAVPEVTPSPQDLQRIIDLIKAENIRALLTEPAAGKASLTALAQDLQLEIGLFDPLETGDPAPETYFKIMRQNAENIANAMNPN